MSISRLIDKTTEGILKDAQFAYDYIIYTDGTYVYAFNTKTKSIDFQGTDAGAVIQSVINALPSGGKILIKAGSYTINTTIQIPPSNITTPYVLILEGEGPYVTQLISGGLPNAYMINSPQTAFNWDLMVIIRYMSFTGQNGDGGIINGAYWGGFNLENLRFLGGPFTNTIVFLGGSGSPPWEGVIKSVHFKTHGGGTNAYELFVQYEGAVLEDVSFYLLGPNRVTKAIVRIQGVVRKITKLSANAGDAINISTFLNVGGATKVVIDELNYMSSFASSGYIIGIDDPGYGGNYSQVLIKYLRFDTAGTESLFSTVSELSTWIDNWGGNEYDIRHGVVTGIPITSVGVQTVTVNFTPSYYTPYVRPRIVATFQDPSATDFAGFIYITNVSNTGFTLNVKITTASATAGATVSVAWIAKKYMPP